MSVNDGSASVTILRREWTIRSNVGHIEPLVSEVVSLCLEAGLSQRACRLNIPVALTEALSNAIVCGNHEDESRSVSARFELNASSLTLEVTDDGNGFDASTVNYSPADSDWLERENGRGLFLMRSLMDLVEMQRPTCDRHGHTVRLVLKRA